MLSPGKCLDGALRSESNLEELVLVAILYFQSRTNSTRKMNQKLKFQLDLFSYILPKGENCSANGYTEISKNKRGNRQGLGKKQPYKLSEGILMLSKKSNRDKLSSKKKPLSTKTMFEASAFILLTSWTFKNPLVIYLRIQQTGKTRYVTEIFIVFFPTYRQQKFICLFFEKCENLVLYPIYENQK